MLFGVKINHTLLKGKMVRSCSTVLKTVHYLTEYVTLHTYCCLVLTYTENVKAKPLCDRFTDQLVREAVESNMAAQTQVPLLFVLTDRNKQNVWFAM